MSIPHRAVVNVATGPHYVKGQARLEAALADENCAFVKWTNTLPDGCPSHQDIPYAFKPFGLLWARKAGYTTLLWCDASIIPCAMLKRLWQKIEDDGYWISRNGWMNNEWTCNEAYPLLGVTPEQNAQIPHVVATAFGLNVASDIGAAALLEYIRLAMNGSFRGPWTGGVGIQHRHDQSALSVIAHRLGMVLSDPPQWFAYKGGETAETVLVADGAY